MPKNKNALVPGKQATVLMDETACSIRGIIDSVRTQLQILEAEIIANEKSKMEYDRHLAMLENRKSDVEKRMKKNTAWAQSYDSEVGPFASRYEEMTLQVAGLYSKAKEGHSKGLILLQKEFGYHPSFKHPGDTFSATPFRPV